MLINKYHWQVLTSSKKVKKFLCFLFFLQNAVFIHLVSTFQGRVGLFCRSLGSVVKSACVMMKTLSYSAQ